MITRDYTRREFAPNPRVVRCLSPHHDHDRRQASVAEALLNFRPLSKTMLFTDVKYAISSSFPDNRQIELEKVLDANGANKADLRQATHVVTDSLQFEGFEKVPPDTAIVSVRKLNSFWQNLPELMGVKDEWVDRSIVFGKQLE